MFSRIPMPQVEWNEKNMRYMMRGFPLVGAVIGLILWGWSLLGSILDTVIFIGSVIHVY